MGRADLLEKFSDEVAGAIDRLGGGEITEDEIRSAVNWPELVKTVIREDPEMMKMLRDKVASLIEERINEAESLGDLVGDEDFNYLEHLPADASVESIIADLFQPAGKLLRTFQKKVVDLISEQIVEANDLEELTGDSCFTWTEHLPEEAKFESIIADLLANDPTVKQKLTEKVQEQVLEHIEGIEENDLPDWDDFVTLLELETRVKELLTTADLQGVVTQRVRGLIDTKIEEDLGTGDLPENFLARLNIEAEVERILADRAFRTEVTEKLQAAVKAFILVTIQDGVIRRELASKVEANADFQGLVNSQISELMRNPEVVINLRQAIKEALNADQRAGGKVISAFFDQIAQVLVDKLLKSLVS